MTTIDIVSDAVAAKNLHELEEIRTAATAA